jgi:hypothetical protein
MQQPLSLEAACKALPQLCSSRVLTRGREHTVIKRLIEEQLA